MEFLHQNPQKFIQDRTDLIVLSINCISFMTMNDDGKEEGVRLNAIEKLTIFFNSENPDIINPIMRTYMFLSIMLKGKQ